MTEDKKQDEDSFPISTTVDKALDFGAAVGSLAPWIGGLVQSILSGYSRDRKLDRLTDWIKSLSDRIEAVHNDAAECFVATDDFRDLFEETAERVTRERLSERRKLYAHFIVNNVGRPDLKYERRMKMLRALETLETTHILTLRALAKTPTTEELEQWSGSIDQTLERRTGLNREELRVIAKELERSDLAKSLANSLGVMMTARGAADLRTRLTPFGSEFLDFLRA